MNKTDRLRLELREAQAAKRDAESRANALEKHWRKVVKHARQAGMPRDIAQKDVPDWIADHLLVVTP